MTWFPNDRRGTECSDRPYWRALVFQEQLAMPKVLHSSKAVMESWHSSICTCLLVESSLVCQDVALYYSCCCVFPVCWCMSESLLSAHSSVERGTPEGKSLIKTRKRKGAKCELCQTRAPTDIGCLQVTRWLWYLPLTAMDERGNLKALTHSTTTRQWLLTYRSGLGDTLCQMLY